MLPLRLRSLLFLAGLACAAGTASAQSEVPPPRGLLFWSGFEAGTRLSAPNDCYRNGCWQDIAGTDSRTGFAWPRGVRFQLLTNAPEQPDPSTVGRWMRNEIRTVIGHRGAPTQALYSEIRRSGCCGTGSQSPADGSTQDPLLIHPAADVPEMYLSQWMMLQPDLPQKMQQQTWREIFEWKTRDTDFRIQLQVRSDGRGRLFWFANQDSFAPRSREYWRAFNSTVPVPYGEWFKLEVYWKRAPDNTGRVWFAVNGQVLAEHAGPTLGPNRSPIDRIMASQLYSGSPYPIYQWLDDVQIWSGFPSARQGDPWYDPPYAPH